MENEAFTFWALFGRATITVKIVMIMLIGSSFWSWSIIFRKLILFRAALFEDNHTLLKPIVSNLIKVAYDPTLPNASDDNSLAVRMSARVKMMVSN